MFSTLALQLRQAAEESSTTGSVVVECDNGNDYDGRLGVRISSIFVILIGSLLGAVLPIILARGSHSNRVNGKAFFVAKYFGSGVIIGTAFLHLLAPAFEALGDPCLPDGPIKDYDWAAAIALISVFVMFTVELLVSKFDIFGHGDHSVSSAVVGKESPSSPIRPSPDDIESASDNAHAGSDGTGFHVPGAPNDLSYPPGGQDHLGHHRDHKDDPDSLAAQLTAIFILEFGVVFHSVFIGLTLAVAGSEFNILYVVLVFHQTFEGLGLGSRLAIAPWPKNRKWWPYLLGIGYALSTPISIAIGLGVRETLQPGSNNAKIVNGIFDSISAGILIYTGLVELLAHEFMFNSEMRNAGLRTQLSALLCVATGTGLMAVLAIWA
ncbi:ZIP zinc/iron transport family [Astrocystis sublimbata]|nr:ZIP zinc/iron transport family [Astrocystis sublimbata]